MFADGLYLGRTLSGERAAPPSLDVTARRSPQNPIHELQKRFGNHAVQRMIAAPSDQNSLRVYRQTDAGADPQDVLNPINMPAFPCNRGGGIVLCNTTVDSTEAPNIDQCIQAGKDIISSCQGDSNDCLAAAKCAMCDCLGPRYCPCTGIV
jgi:hypothetical protein